MMAGQIRVLSPGRIGNATVRLCRVAGEDWVIKDFRPKPWPIRVTAGRHFLSRELRALERLSGVRGIPQGAFRLDADAIAYRHLPGEVLHKVPVERLPETFFPQLEHLVQTMHGRGLAHLDLRYRHNILVLADGTPGLIDFQSQVSLDRLPAGGRRRLMRVDLSGVYKHWRKRYPATLDAGRRALLERQNWLRRFWILRGYAGLAGKGRRR
jgi:RIO-like serine/threonine protein kinase